MRVLLWLLLALVPTTAAAAHPPLDAEEIEFLRLLNEYRAAHGLPCLSASPTMNAAAAWMSEAMGTEDFFSHDEPSGRSFDERIGDFGHDRWRTAGENIAAGQRTPREVFEAWRASPGHDRNMRRPEFRAIGIGREEVPGSRYRVYWTTDFSDWVDGDHRCEEGLPSVGWGGVGAGDEPVDGPSGGDPVAEGPGDDGHDDGGADDGRAGEGPDDGGRVDGGREGGPSNDDGDGDASGDRDEVPYSAGCAAAGPAPSLLGLALLAALPRRRRARAPATDRRETARVGGSAVARRPGRG